MSGDAAVQRLVRKHYKDFVRMSLEAYDEVGRGCWMLDWPPERLDAAKYLPATSFGQALPPGKGTDDLTALIGDYDPACQFVLVLNSGDRAVTHVVRFARRNETP